MITYRIYMLIETKRVGTDQMKKYFHNLSPDRMGYAEDWSIFISIVNLVTDGMGWVDDHWILKDFMRYWKEVLSL